MASPAPATGNNNSDEPGPVQLKVGKIVAKEWKILEKLGEGGCGAVYLVESEKDRSRAALKAESLVADGSVLKQEVQVLIKLTGRKYVAQLISHGKRAKYGYMVMTVFGHSLTWLFNSCNREFTQSTQIRLGLQMLYGLKQLHEVGYIHRDVKPGNFAIGKKGKASRVLHLLDFGLCRQYIVNSEGKTEIRKIRKNTLFRGTPRYCSANANCRGEQGRVDDLWSMLYILAEMRGPLPWEQLRDIQEIAKLKKGTSDDKLLSKCPSKMLGIATHLRELDYHKRPDYAKLYQIMNGIMVELEIKHSDLFDWEKQPNYSPSMTSEGKDAALQPEDFDDKPPFAPVEFEKNELGF